MSDFGIKQTRRILICSANDDNTRNYDRAHWLAVAFIKLIRFYPAWSTNEQSAIFSGNYTRTKSFLCSGN